MEIRDKTKNQAKCFGGIRFAAAIIIIIFHYNKLTGGVHDDPNLPLYSILRTLFTVEWLLLYAIFRKKDRG